MFSVYSDDPKRRRKHWSKATVAVSILAHAAAVGGIALSARYAEAKVMEEVVIAEWNLEDEPVKPEEPKPEPPPPPPPPKEEPPQPKEPPKVELAKEPEPPRAPRQPPAPVKGDFVTPRPPETPPVGIPAPDMNARPITEADVSGIGKEGDVIGTVDESDTRAPTGHTEPAPPTPEPAPVEPTPEPVSNEPMSESAVDVRPSLRNASDVQRALERVYPEQLRDAGVTGQTVLQFVIDENGRVEPSSVEILSSSNDQFAAAARRIVSSMRFSPAKSGGRTVRVTTTLPVTWAIGE